MRKHLLFLTIAFFSFNLLAQQECAFILEEAQEKFDAGLIETIPDDLSGCLESGFTNEEKLQAFKLIILSYLFDDNIEQADVYMLKFLDDYPAYEPVATDPREFVLLMETYDRDPVLMIGGGVGANISHPIPTLLQGINDFLDHDGDYLPGGVGFDLNFQIQKQFTDKLGLSVGLTFVNTQFHYTLDNDDDIIIPTADITDFSIVDYYETQNLLRLPIGILYAFSNTDFKPYVKLGMSPGLLFIASGESTRQYAHIEDFYQPIQTPGVDLMPGRRQFNLWAYTGVGFNYKLGPGNFFVDLRYYANLMNQIKPGTNSFIFEELIWSQYYVSDRFLLNNLSFSAGYMFPIYNPKKRDL